MLSQILIDLLFACSTGHFGAKFLQNHALCYERVKFGMLVLNDKRVRINFKIGAHLLDPSLSVHKYGKREVKIGVQPLTIPTYYVLWSET